MDGSDLLTERFEADRGRLRAVAFRMLGSLDDADDALQETWLKAHGADLRDVRNLSGWLTVTLSRECLDVLRARRRHPRAEGPDDLAAATTVDEEVLLADSVGRALLVVLDRLTPTERIAFVLHDAFGVPFADIAEVVGRGPDAAKQLASRGRRKARSAGAPNAATRGQRRLAEAFLAAAREGDVAALLHVLAPDVVRSADAAAVPAGFPRELHGADAVVRETLTLGGRARYAEPALIDGRVGLLVAPRGVLRLALILHVHGDRIARYDVVADPERLARLQLAVLDDVRVVG